MRKFVLYLLFILFIFPTVTEADDNLGITLPADGWPNIPLVIINTVDSVMPSCTLVQPPEGCNGLSITNNNYVYGSMSITQKGVELYNSGKYEDGKSGMKIKVRGNTSAFLECPHYKIKLTKKSSLLYPHGEYKDWVLLKINLITPNKYDVLNTVVGQKVSQMVGIEWQPKNEFVNLIINGNYRGLYLLSDAVEANKGRCEIEKTGYLIENDSYWWNADSIFFRTNYQLPVMGYTYKYPDPDDVTDSITENIRNYINSFEDSLYSDTNTRNISDYIDIPSFASWILAHDILGTQDMGGSNMFLYKKNFDVNDPTSTKLIMGPMWDFDTSYLISDWTQHHVANVLYFPTLFKRMDFVTQYVKTWDGIKNHLCNDMNNLLDSIYAAEGDDIDKSLLLDTQRWHSEFPTLRETVDFTKSWFATRVDWLNSHIGDLVSVAGTEQVPTVNDKTIRLYDIRGLLVGTYANLQEMKRANLPKGVYIYQTFDGGKKSSSSLLVR